MSEIDNWDEQLRDQLSDQEFPFDETNWEKARMLIDESRDKKRRFILFFLWPALIGVLATGAFTAYHWLGAPAEKSTAVSATGYEVWTQVELKSTEKHLYPVQNNDSEELKRRKREYALLSKSISATPAWQQYVSFNSDVAPAAQSPENYVTVQGTQGGTTQSANAANGLAAANQPSAQGADLSSVAAINGQNMLNTNNETEGFAWMQPVLITDLAQVSAGPEIVSKPIAFTKSLPDARKEPIVKMPRSVVWAEAGSDYSLGWKNNGVREGNGFNPILGLGYSYRIWRGLGASVGVQYNSISRLGTSTYTANLSTVYDFGLQKQVTNINTTRLHYLVVPVKVNYAFNGNVIGVGANIGYLLQSSNTVETYREMRRQQYDYQKTRTTGYRDGFNALDMQVSLSYRRYLFKGFSASAEMFYGLSPVKRDQWLRQDGASNHSGFKLLLSYDLFRK